MDCLSGNRNPIGATTGARAGGTASPAENAAGGTDVAFITGYRFAADAVVRAHDPLVTIIGQIQKAWLVAQLTRELIDEIGADVKDLTAEVGRLRNDELQALEFWQLTRRA